MKLRFLSSTVLAGAAIFSTSAVQASVARNAGETNITLESSHLRWPLDSHVTVPATEHVKLVASPAPWSTAESGWFKNGRRILEANGPVLIIDVAQPSDAGRYEYTILGPHILENFWQSVTLDVRPSTHLVNLSTRGFAGQGDQTMICGFIVAGAGENSPSSTVLIRAVGPSLARFGVGGVLREPKITIFTADGRPYTAGFIYPLETGYLTKEQHIQAITTKVGAFQLDAGAKDAVELRPFPPGAYTVQVTGADGSSGNVLMETYEAPE